MTLVASPTVGLEDIQRESIVVLFENLNDKIAEIEDAWTAKDEDFAVRMGRPVETITLERVAPENFYSGHRPSLIKAPIANYPNVAAMALQATPATGSEQMDQMTVYRNLLVIDVMIKSEVSEEEANSRIHRMADAVNACIMANRSLNGIVHGLETDPTVRISDLFVRKERTAYGSEWFWQGARLEYAVRKAAADSTSVGGPFFGAARSGENPDHLSIDQA